MNYELKPVNGKMAASHAGKQTDTTKYFAGIFIGALTVLIAI